MRDPPPAGRPAGSCRQASTSPVRHIGTLTLKIQRQLMLVMISPAITGPKIGTTTTGRLIAAISRPILAVPTACTSSVVISGVIIPPPMPWTTRNAIRLSMFQAAPQATDPARNRASENVHTARPPNRESAQPLSGMTMANDSRYPVITH
jgi:hypothetical protein